MKVFITGGTGFLGRGLLRRFAQEWDITVYSRDESKQAQCTVRWPNVKYVLGDVLNQERLYNNMVGCDLVIHAAAVKFIPEAELNVNECIDVNLLGTRNVLEAATRTSSIRNVVCVSTDKACHPLNVYGATKMLVERMVGEYARYNRNSITYTACRYGNVVGSTGSVVPLFQRQARLEKRVTVTDPDMTRYWITVDDAIDLILAATRACSGDVVIPTPAAMRMGDVASLFDVPVEVIGVRPGEKKHEWLLHEQESIRAEYKSSDGVWCLHQGGVYSEPFVLSSDKPAVWMDHEEMRRAIADAETV
jgi:UDP-N-acetylglucosamine 4,6-dehydratase/5-epimerase